MKLYIFAMFLLSFCYSSAFTNFYQYSPAPATIKGVSYPRNSLTLYRGTTYHQMSLSKALRAMLGDSSAYLESLYFSTIKAKLMGVSFASAVHLPGPVESQIQSAINKAGRTLNESSAARESVRIVDGSFSHYENQGTLLGNYINYRSSNWVDWPNDVVFSSIVSPAAATYGDRIVVIEERSPRSIDLNYWNLKHNDVLYDHTRDAGEFVTHGYIPPEDIIGYQMRSGSAKSWHQIDFSFYKSGDQILVFSGERASGGPASCMLHNTSSGEIYICNYSPGSITLVPPSASSELAKLVGVIVKCTDSVCADPKWEAAAKYPKASTELSQSILSEIRNTSWKSSNGLEFVPIQ